MEGNKNKSPMSTAGFVCGLISVLFVFFYYLAIPTGVLGIVFGAIGTKKTGSKLAKAGMILGIIGTTICIGLYIMFIMIITLDNM